MKNQIVKFVIVGIAALLIPPVLAIPPVKLTFDTMAYLVGGLIVFYTITCITARKEYRGWIALIPVVLIVGVAVSYIPVALTGWKLVGYYAVLFLALVVSIISHLLGARDDEYEVEEDVE